MVIVNIIIRMMILKKIMKLFIMIIGNFINKLQVILLRVLYIIKILYYGINIILYNKYYIVIQSNINFDFFLLFLIVQRKVE